MTGRKHAFALCCALVIVALLVLFLETYDASGAVSLSPAGTDK